MCPSGRFHSETSLWERETLGRCRGVRKPISVAAIYATVADARTVPVQDFTEGRRKEIKLWQTIAALLVKLNHPLPHHTRTPFRNRDTFSFNRRTFRYYSYFMETRRTTRIKRSVNSSGIAHTARITRITHLHLQVSQVRQLSLLLSYQNASRKC